MKTLQVIFLGSIAGWLVVPVAGTSRSCLAIMPLGPQIIVFERFGVNGGLDFESLCGAL